MNLPLEIITNILSRLPILAIVRLKCVCEPWLGLLQSPQFANLHLSKSSPGILVHQQQWDSSLFKFSELIEDELGELNCVPVAKFDIIKVFHGCPTIVGSVDGFLCLRSWRPFDDLYIFNLIKHQYISIPAHQRETPFPFTVSHGFGLSTNSGQYKFVLIFQESEPDPTARVIPRCDSHIYTLGTTGKWKCIASINNTPLNYCCYSIGASLNGNLHWLAEDVEDSRVIYFLDLDKEVFGTFSAPPLPGYMSKCLARLVALGDRLCVCDNTCENDIVVWIMKDYGGDEYSWTREFVISKMENVAGSCLDVVSPIKMFKNGDILMKWGDYYLVYYSNRNKTISRIDGIQRDNCWAMEAVLHVPALVSLTCFARESVNSF